MGLNRGITLLRQVHHQDLQALPVLLQLHVVHQRITGPHIPGLVAVALLEVLVHTADRAVVLQEAAVLTADQAVVVATAQDAVAAHTAGQAVAVAVEAQDAAVAHTAVAPEAVAVEAQVVALLPEVVPEALQVAAVQEAQAHVDRILTD